MSRRDPMVAVQQTRDSAQLVLATAQTRSRDDLDSDALLEAGMTRWMELIGEAARRVPDEFRERYPGVPWRQTTDLRNVLIHDYDTADLDELWRIIHEHLPPLVEQLQAIIDENTPAK